MTGETPLAGGAARRVVRDIDSEADLALANTGLGGGWAE